MRCRSQESEALHGGHRATEDYEGGRVGWISPLVHYHLHPLERVHHQVVLTVPEHQLIHLLSICRLIAVLYVTNDSDVDHKPQDLHRGVRGSVIGLEGEEQRREDASLAGCRC